MVVDSLAIEFGYELIQVLPWAYYLHKQGKLTKTVSAVDTDCLYYFSPNHEEKYFKRQVTYILDNPKFPITKVHVPKLDKSQWEAPPLKEYYKNDEFVFEKPLLVIMNKYNKEWNGPPVNYLSLDMIKALVKHLSPKYQIVYNRADKHTSDEVTQKNLQEKDFIRENYPEIIMFEDLYSKYRNVYTFNTLQMKLYANCDYFITVQGGFSLLASFFAKKNFIYAMAGNEIKVGSYSWYHEFSGSEIYHYNNYQQMLSEIKDQLL